MPKGSVTVLLFGPAREAVGRPAVDWPVDRDGVEARELVRSLGERYPALAATLRASRFVRNGEYLTVLSARIRAGDEFAVHPPYGGG
jgi:molybdopterin converting factor small subunit